MTQYVVAYTEHLRDGRESGAKIADSVEHALEIATRMIGSFGGGTTTVKLFELGREIPLKLEKVAVPQPPVVTKRIVLGEMT